VFVQFVTDVMLDIIWVSRPNLAVEIHISGPNSLLIDRDSDLLPGSALHRGAKICEAPDWSSVTSMTGVDRGLGATGCHGNRLATPGLGPSSGDLR
jgi:hypothetical protein